METTSSEPVALYRLYDADDALLYVGISNRPEIRLDEHSKSKPWWSDVARREITWCDSRDSALAAELAAIHGERPVHNVQNSPWTREPELPPPGHQSTREARRNLPELINMGSATVIVNRQRRVGAVTESYWRPVAVIVPVEWYRAAKAALEGHQA